jgi:hypothetical protein
MRRRAAVAIAAVALVAGCGQSGATPTPSPAPTTATTAPSEAALSSPSPKPSSPPTPFPLPQGSDAVELDPASFAGVAIDNPFWPMPVGRRWVYTETTDEGAEQRVEVTVLDQTKEIIGIQAQVVHDIVTLDGETVEDTIDWYAQDGFGNLWYMGEDTKEYENGKVVTTEGSWQAGVDGAQPGIILPADPQVGMTYRQEYYAGQAEDAAEILAVDEHVEVPAGTYDGCVKTSDYTPLDPAVEEQKYYARDVGPVHVVQTKGGTSEEKLIEFTPGG